MNYSRLNVCIAFPILAITGVFNILNYSIDESYVAFGKSSEEIQDEAGDGEEKNLNKKP